MNQQRPDVGSLNDRYIQHLRRNAKTTQSWACQECDDRRIFYTTDDLWAHCLDSHSALVPEDESQRQTYRKRYEELSSKKTTAKDDFQQARRPPINQASIGPPDPPPGQQGKRPLHSPHAAPHRSLSGLQTLTIGGTQKEGDDVPMQDISDENPVEQPRKRAAIGDGISAGSASPLPFRDSESPPPRRSKARPTSAPYSSISDPDTTRRQNNSDDTQRPSVGKRMLWRPDQDPVPRGSFDPSNIASPHTQKSRNQALQNKPRKSFQPQPQGIGGRQSQAPPIPTPPIILGRSSNEGPQSTSNDVTFDIVLQPETRPISQEQLVAEVKGIYAGLVMVEAKCIEVDNKQATLASADPGAHPKLNNEQWQALIALHRTLLHEHHDFFLASQHPSASPALRRLASKYAMPARMWRHGIHSFLELLRHRLPASLDHMLAFIYLAYSMMALLYETVPAFEDTWIECLGDLGRYRMAIEDDDIRDREVWTGVARHWYSKASDKAPTTGRLYHHLAILARPNALQQLFYYSKSLCVAIPFTSARESILTLFDPLLNAENGHGQYRLPAFDAAFVKAHGLLFTNRNLERFGPAVDEFLSLLDNQIGRVTRKFTEQGYYLAVANSVAMLGFAAKDNVLMKAISSPSRDEPDTEMSGTEVDVTSPSMKSFERAQRLTNATLDIVLQRIGDPNVLPFIHVTLVFMHNMARHRRAMQLLEETFPWKSLVVMLNTLLALYKTPGRIEDNKFPLPEKDDVRPFTEDFAMRGLLWADGYYPSQWFSNDKIDDEEKYLELPSMTDDRKERILWLACRIAEASESRLKYEPANEGSTNPKFSVCIDPLPSRSPTFASANTASCVGGTEALPSVAGHQSDGEEEMTVISTPQHSFEQRIDNKGSQDH